MTSPISDSSTNWGGKWGRVGTDLTVTQTNKDETLGKSQAGEEWCGGRCRDPARWGWTVDHFELSEDLRKGQDRYGGR